MYNFIYRRVVILGMKLNSEISLGYVKKKRKKKRRL